MDGIAQGWWWLIGGVLLLIAEVVAPGFFLLFIGVAAMITGLFVLLFDFGLAPALALFAIYTAVAVYFGRKVYANRPVPSSARHLNDRSGALVGRTAVAVSTIDDHNGRVRLGDSEWSARGGPAAPGERVEIVGVEGNCLMVRPSPNVAPAQAGTSGSAV
ncbi:NfeD family protein [Sphingomonas astaxanthinifaciens]|uniref:Membrane protein n=1 Tax=Sphingomonas astaxanthinifaciens DSM 22298 TaxID=1123267 RepID=A0ABQ5Z389_9SPHN|nr:NfeD family protein [Sphingomonas astaxanthinifaciens]GLR46429.1 membrane protein [Sphingomonas astaxanthinifaciens DSM 22298]